MKQLIGIAAIALALLGPGAIAEDETRDFYAEPGMNPFRTSAGQDSTENIDPFSGNLQLSYVDLSIPGNGGLDINITRYYNLPQGAPGYANPFGYGWTMHFGRITIGSGHARQLCGGEPAPDSDTLDNPSIEMPDGGRELLVYSAALDDGSYITKSNWRARCIDPADYTRGLVATAPDGTAYYMREYVFMQGEDGAAGEPAPFVETWLTNRIADAHGNNIDVTYLALASGMKVVTGLESSDGRRVSFEYLDSTGAPATAASYNARLALIESNGQVWTYEHAPLDGAAAGWDAVDHYRLTAVVRPDGTRWRYDYGDVAGEPGHNRLSRVTYPAGGVVNYAYQWLQPYLPNPDLRLVVIARKDQENPGYAGGTWLWEFYPGHTDFAELGVQPLPENAGRMADFTRITTPGGEEHVYHVGYWALVGTHDILWQMGLKILHRHFQRETGGGLSLLRSESNSWSSRTISPEIYRGGVLSSLWDEATHAPVLTRRNVQVDGYNYATDYGNHDAFGNPGRTLEWAAYPSEGGNRITDTSYLNDTKGWFIGLPAVETMSRDGIAAGTISRTFTPSGRLEREERFGVVTAYSYTDEGDLASVTDALGNTHRYSDYFRGTPTREDLPDGSSLARVVNATGTVASRTSGRGNTTAFRYDGLNRLTGIDYPLGHDVAVSYTAGGKSLIRGDYGEDVSWDGFGRETAVVRRNLASGENFERVFSYDLFGRRTFESNINSALGITREYDVIGREKRIVNQDGSTRTIAYEGAHRELHTDENGNVTDFRYQVYGSPRHRFLSWVIAPENVGTNISRDARGNITAVFQGNRDPGDPARYLGYTRTYSYNERLQLTAIDSPAGTGTTTYGRDTLGNMTWRQSGSGNRVHFSYDSMNRPITADYLDDALDTSYSYDADGNLTAIANAFTTRTSHYNENGRLTAEELAVGESVYSLVYTLDDLDHTAALTYPSGRTVDYAPDPLGRATRALPYLTAVSYHPDGAPSQFRYANGQLAEFARTARGQVDRIDIGTFASLDYSYDATGNVTAIDDLTDPGNNRGMTYDGLHRLTAARGPWGNASYAYDAFGNLTRKSDPAQGNRSQYYSYLGLMLDQVTYGDSAARRVFTHDANGNIAYSDDAVFDPLTGLPVQVLTTRRQLFDDAGNLAFAQRSARDDLDNVDPLRSGSFSSEYDASNRRVRKINHSQENHVTDYLYSSAGLLLGEYDAAGNYYGNEYFYLGNQQIATAKFNAPPTVELGDDRQAEGGEEVPLRALHGDLDGTVVAIEWTQLSGPTVSIADAAASQTYFTAPYLEQAQEIVFRSTVTDDRGGQAHDLLTVTVQASQPPLAVEQLAALPRDGGNLVVWNPLPDVAAYDLYWSTDPDQPAANRNQAHVTGRHFMHRELVNGQAYHYAVGISYPSGYEAFSPVVTATPAPQEWQAPRRLPDDLIPVDPATTAVAANSLGDAVILTEQFSEGVYRLYAWLYRPFAGWNAAELLHENAHPHSFTTVAMDEAGNVLASWAGGTPGSRDLFASYRPVDAGFLPAEPVEHYSGNSHVNGDIVAISHLEFDARGEAWICWRQNRLHVFNGYFDPDGASALAGRFQPGQGWSGEHILEVANNVGDSLNLSCDVSGNGNLVAAWERYNTYDPQPFSLGGHEHDIWVAAFDPQSGWTGSETVEYLEYGIREDNGLGIQNHQPDTAVHDAGAIVVWRNASDANIEAMEYDFGTSAWLPRETVESRANRIPDPGGQHADANSSGDLMLSWGDQYITRLATDARWDRARSFPGLPLLAGLDEEGHPFAVHGSGDGLVASHSAAGAWTSHTLAGPASDGPYAALYAGALATDSLQIFWTTGEALYLSSEQSISTADAGNPGNPDTTPPVTVFTSTVTRVKGSSQHDVMLRASEPGITRYRLSGQATFLAGGDPAGGDPAGDWQVYNEPLSILVDKRGTATLEFYSQDQAGNTETIQTEILQ